MGFWEDFLGKPTKLKAFKESFTRQSEVDLAQKTATQGLPDSYEDALRKKAVSDIYRPVDYSFFGGNAARAIAGTQQTDASRVSSVSEFDMKLGMQDIQAKMQGQQQFAGLQSERKAVDQRNAERQFQTDQQNKVNEDQWKSGLISGVAGFATKLAFAPASVLGETVIGSAVGSMFGDKTPKPVDAPKLNFDATKTPTLNQLRMFDQQPGLFGSDNTDPEFESFYSKISDRIPGSSRDLLWNEYQQDPTMFKIKYAKVGF